jgi:hypothetical protein
MSEAWVAMQASKVPIIPSWRENALGQRPTTGTGTALVAGHRGIVEIRTAGALHQIAGGCGPVAQLSRCTGQQCARQHPVVPPDPFIRRKIGVAHECPDAQPAVGGLRNLVEAGPGHIDQMAGRLDPQLHQIQQIGAAGDELGTGCFGGPCRGLVWIARAFVGKRPHACSSATCVMVAKILE